MMNKHNLIFRSCLAAVTILTTTLMTSCYKEQDSIARVKVIDSNSQVVSNAMVRLYPSPDPQLGLIVVDDTLYTKADGMATFNFSDEFEPGQSGLMVLDIEVRDENGNLGSGIIRIEEETTNDVTVVIP